MLWTHQFTLRHRTTGEAEAEYFGGGYISCLFQHQVELCIGKHIVLFQGKHWKGLRQVQLAPKMGRPEFSGLVPAVGAP